MTAFWQGVKFGFANGMLNNMFGGFGFWGGFSPCCWSPWQFNPTPLFFTPTFQGNFYQYPTYTPAAPCINTPTWSIFQNQVQSSFNPGWGDFCSFSTSKSSNTSSQTTSPINKSSQKTLKSKHWSKMSDSEMREVYGNYTKDITTMYTGTAEQLNKYLKGKGVLEGKGQAFIDAQNKYGISAIALIAICMNESAKGTSKLAKNKNNVGGVRISGSNEFRNFDSVEACIDYMASFLKSGYVNQSLTKLYQVNAKYCPASDPTDKTGNNNRWAKAVDMYMDQVSNVA